MARQRFPRGSEVRRGDPSRRRACVAGVLALAALLAMATPALAAPFVPDRDDVVLERLPERTDPSLADLKRLRRALAQRTDDLALASRFARRAIEASRERGDPRFLGQAQAALAPWWSQPQPPLEALVLRATIEQSLHAFPQALADLDRVVARAPRHGQALLTRATILTVVGRYAEARRDCASLAGLAAEIVTVACAAGPQSRQGQGPEAYRALAAALERADPRAPDVLVWGHTLAAEIAESNGDAAAAEAHFRRALAADPADAYLKGAYADFLVDHGRPREAAVLVARDTANDALLLRLGLALARIGDPTPEERRALDVQRAELAARFAASRARGDTVHRREEARFALALEGDARRAVQLARANWEVQREAADLRILREAGEAADDAAAIETARSWARAHGLAAPSLAANEGGRQ